MAQTDDRNRRRPKAPWILDPSTFAPKDFDRARQWATEKMKKHERFMKNSVPDRKIIAHGGVEPDEIDIRAIYPYPDLRWYIFREGQMWSFMLCSRGRLLFKVQYAKI